MHFDIQYIILVTDNTWNRILRLEFECPEKYAF